MRTRIVAELGGNLDLAVVLHAYRSAAIVAHSKARFPSRPVLLVITGTDLYQHGDTTACQRSFALADRIVVAQPTMIRDLPVKYRSKTESIFQSATASSLPRPTRPRQLRVVVFGHLRQVKDPFRAAMAVRQLPTTSKIVVEHYGTALHPSMENRAIAETARNTRYRWLGEVTRGEVRRKLATAWLMVLSSRMEGGANVLSEAVAAHTPLLASRIPGTTGLLGEHYKGLFEVGDTHHLRQLLNDCETNPSFYRHLQSQVAAKAHLVSRPREINAWKRLLAELQ